MYCKDCGVPDIIEQTGTLTIQTGDKQVERFYPSIAELEKEIQQLLLLSDDSEILVKTSSMRGKYAPEHFLKLVQNSELVELIANQSFTTHFQPIIDLQNKDELFAYECLLRPQWQGDSVPPFKLFEFARDTNLHNYLDQKARESSIVSASRQHLSEDVKLFINFLPSSIYNPEFCLQHTFKIVQENNIAPSQLVFEVVESEKILDIDHLESIFKTYKQSGMQVALDDVGAGYATLEVLEKLQPDFVKIDRKYISHCDSTLEKQLFLKSVMSLAAKLDINVLAEGIERPEELEFCRNIGIHYGQGYLIGKPSPDTLTPVLTGQS
ncbi:EAL domain-containing protein [Sutcliffiella horikoshii]|uniref:EAL domain-containing protein n=1 Tax=Sutcliffiella horikoshii TaxID=79883 RepID=UPI00203C380A|nr:EAL domain-containing protein [Sutcliffiella horikoshii]MCM3618615.1 EAL domain-containing protein [Sutcliffiella horikoshii]